MKSSTVIANDANPQIPTALAPVIAGFASMSDARRVPMHHNLGTFVLNSKTGAVTQKSQAAGTLPAVTGSTALPNFTYTTSTGAVYELDAPYDFATIYDLKATWTQGYDGTGQTIAILSPSDLNQSDVYAFRAQFGLPAMKLNKIYASINPAITTNVDETALDVEWSGAVAKRATIDLVIGATSLTADGVDVAALYAVNNDIAPIISLSYGECEAYLGASGNAFYSSLWQQAAAQGQSVFVASGDAGATIRTCWSRPAGTLQHR
jgi:subtilase family serine protease